MSKTQVGQNLQGRLGEYIISRQIQEAVWFAENQRKESVVNILQRFRRLTPHLRSLPDEVQKPAEPPIINTPNQEELKHVTRCILESWNVKLDNIFLGDLRGCYNVDSEFPKGDAWNTATDIWSFGAVLISLIYRSDFNLFRSRTIHFGHKEYNLEVLKKQFRDFGSFPAKYEETASPAVVTAILYLMPEISQSQTDPFP
ncbi:uncharacterized protein BDW43DRAFT_302476 [Aspergillus alliaceus]|uniref:uncharacterized protein n=1 Tax=Petromyces alliaceus TaxID=209559 RepID=UPI0012A51AB8|nr:uncharacterized protein BDW43DRAFT_302476 [Aspergillus alliaceus]KAB8230373.1 hypothetical protein BDW43DRAFT_302476 [Aspergillus alliaceus]